MLTGEPMPVSKAAGDRVIGGTVNRTGAFRYRATTLGEASVLARIVRLMRDAQSTRAPIQALADRISAVFVPVVIGLAVATFARLVGAGRHGADRPRLRRSRHRADHRLPVRDGTGGADRRDGGQRPRGVAGHADQGRRGAAARRRGHHRRARQDGHGHRRPAGGDRCGRGARMVRRPGRARAAGRFGRGRCPSIRWPAPSWRSRKRRGLSPSSRRQASSRSRDRASAATVDGHLVHVGNARAAGVARRLDRRASRGEVERLARDGAHRRCSSPSTAGSPASSPSPTR